MRDAGPLPEEVKERALVAAFNRYSGNTDNAVAAAEVAYAAGRADERAQVVTWLRAGHLMWSRIPDRIERGEHLGD